jgi:CRISPR-associated protein Cmr6
MYDIKIPDDTNRIISETAIDNFNLSFNKYRKWDNYEVKDFQINQSYSFKYLKRINEKILDILITYKKLGYIICFIQGTVDWKMAVGIGNSHIAETSITLHYIYGMPYIPGSALKGIMRYYYISDVFEKTKMNDMVQILVIEKIFENFEIGKDNNISFENFKEEFKIKDQNRNRIILPTKELYNFFLKKIDIIKEFQLIFGTQNNSGKVIFLDSYPIGNINFENDIMTPHYTQYYSNKNNSIPPGDYFNPKPIKFLTVNNTSFQFGLIVKSMEIKKDILDNLLTQALKNNGIGAKTAVGYGYFKDVNDITSKIDDIIKQVEQEQKEIEINSEMKNMSEIEKEIYLLRDIKNPSVFNNSIYLYSRIGNYDKKEKTLIALALKEIWIKLGKWEKPQSKKQIKKIEYIKDILNKYI